MAIDGTTDASLRSVWSELHTFERIYHKVVRLEEGLLALLGGQVQSGSGVVAAGPGIDIVSIVPPPVTLLDGSRQLSYRWETLASALTVGEQNFAVTRLGDDIYVVNGNSGVVTQPSNAMNVVTYRRAPPLDQVRVLGTTPFRLAAASMVRLSDGALGICGGFTAWNIPSNESWQYDVATDTWAPGNTMKQARLDHELVTIAGRGGLPNWFLAVGGRVPVTRPVANPVDAHYWRFDGNGHDEFGGLGITLAGGATASNLGKAGTCVRMNGGTAVSSAGAGQVALNAAMLADITVEGWITKGTGTVFSCGGSGSGGAANDSLLAFGVDAGTGKFFVRWQHDANVAVLNETTASYTDLLAVADSISAPIFYHFAVTRTAAGNLALYVNGALIQSWTDPLLTTPVAGDGTAALFHVGRDSTGTFGAWTGAIDELRISTGARSASELTNHFDYQKGDIYFDRPVVANRPHPGRCLETCESLIQVDGDYIWSRSGSMAYARFGFGAVNLPDGRIIVVGGLGYRAGDAIEPVPLRSCEIFDPVTRLWHQLPDLAYARDFPVVALVGNTVIVAGGRSARTHEILDLRTMTWKRGISSMATAHYRSAGGLLSDDLVLVTGGAVNASIQPTEAKTYLLTPGRETLWQGGLNRQVVVASVPDVPSPTSFTYLTPGYPESTSQTSLGSSVTRVAAEPSTIPGPFAFDPNEGVAITGTEAQVGEGLEQGRQYGVLSLKVTIGIDESPALQFPDQEGFLAFNFGTDNAEQPVRYLGRQSSTALKLDYNYRFQHGVSEGATVYCLAQRAPFRPKANQLTGAFYATASAAGRGAAIAAVDEMVGAGVTVRKMVVYPGDRGLGAEGFADRLAQKLSDRVVVWGGDEPEVDLANTRKGEF